MSMIGQTLRHYRIEAKLGEGGMGVVYRALDTHLDRPVAIKVLPPQAVADPDRKRRFVQEAKAASALNHPNIITIHDVDQADGADFIVMECVPGRTLDQVIGRKGLRVSEALRYATQIVDALARAHGVGIVHRDLKPGNIMVTPEGVVKVLDFGLAKLIEPDQPDDLVATRTLAADAAARTEAGAIVGTVAYMSPEQAEGRKVDARSDIFSFGLLLYEMLTGRRAFQGETKLSTLAAILHHDPKPLGEAAEGVPRDLEKIILRCLRKDLRRRFQHMDDLLVALEDVKEDSASAPAVSVPVPTRRRRPWLVLALGVFLAAALALGWWLGRGRAPEATRPALLTRLTSDSGLTTAPALSPKGDLVAYASDRSGEDSLDIWVQQVSGGEPIRRTTESADDSEPSFSPDGARIAFRSERAGGGVYVMPTLAGEERPLAKDGRGPRFSPDGKWIAYWTGIGGRYETSYPKGYQLYLVPSTGGAPRQIAPDFDAARYPVWSPNGQLLLFEGRRAVSDPMDWWVIPLDSGPAATTGARQVLALEKLQPHGGPRVWTGDAIFFSAALADALSIWKMPIAAGSRRITAPPQRLTFGTNRDGEPSVAGNRLVFPSLTENIDVWSLPLDANQAKVTGPLARLTESAAPDLRPAVSPDGKRVVFESFRNGNRDLWLKDLASGRETALTGTSGQPELTAFSHDGGRVAYNVVENDRWAIHIATVGSRDFSRKVCDDCGIPADWSPDGTKLLSITTQQPRRVLQIDVATGRHEEYLRREAIVCTSRRSRPTPDGSLRSVASAPRSFNCSLSRLPVGSRLPARNGSPFPA